MFAPKKICLANHYNFVMIAQHLWGLTAALVSAVEEVDRPQPVVERAAAALLRNYRDAVLSVSPS